MNGEPREVAEGLSLVTLLDELGVGGRRVAVELNQDVVPRERYADTTLRPGDVVEVVQFVGGG